MKPLQSEELKTMALNVRETIIRLSGNGGCFIGASLSCADLIVYLYKNFLEISQDTLQSPERDYLFLSKGHDVPALYATFVELGWLDRRRLLDHHLKTDDSIYWHPNRKIPGVEFHSGSLGHLLPVALGVAMDCKEKGLQNKIVVIVGDGELNEGSNWEALLVAQAHRVHNLIVVVDRNQFQANMRTEDLIPLEPLDQKFTAFGFETQTVDGHDFDALNAAFSKIRGENLRPQAVIANTLRGKGLPSIAERADRWFCNFSGDEIESLIKELYGEHSASLHSETLIVR